MKQLSQQEITDYVEANIPQFHHNRLKNLLDLKLEDILKRKNPYLFRAKNINTAGEFVRNILDAFLSSSEEGLFGAFLEGLAVFVCSQTLGGRKSIARGIDLEFETEETKYIVSIKSGPNWGNSDQVKKMTENFRDAKKTLRTNAPASMKVTAVNGCCYGQDNQPDKGDYLKLCGQSFWTLISGNESLYTDIIEPLGHRAKEKNERFMQEYAKVINKFTYEFIQKFCDPQGQIHWDKIVQLNSARRSDLERYPIAIKREKSGDAAGAARILEEICREGTPEAKIHRKLAKLWRNLYKEHLTRQKNDEAIHIFEQMLAMYERVEASDTDDIRAFAKLYAALSDARSLLKIAQEIGDEEWAGKARNFIRKLTNVQGE